MISRRLIYPGPDKASLQECILADVPEKGTVRVRALFSGISRGTESLVFRGLVPESEHHRMRCPHQHGDFSFPLSYGYAIVGEVEATGQDTDELSVGDRVFCLHPHQDVFDANIEYCHPLPEGLPMRRAIVAANAETALNAAWDAGLQTAQAICVIGAGVVGLLTAFIIRELTGITPKVIDTDLAKQKVTQALGLEFLTVQDAISYEETAPSHLFNTTANPAGLQLAIDMAGFEATIVEMSWFGDKPVQLTLGGNFHAGRLRLISSQVGHISPARRADTSHAERMQQALSLLADPRLDVLLEKSIEFDKLPAHLPSIFRSGSGTLCQVVEYGQI